MPGGGREPFACPRICLPKEVCYHINSRLQMEKKKWSGAWEDCWEEKRRRNARVENRVAEEHERPQNERRAGEAARQTFSETGKQENKKSP